MRRARIVIALLAAVATTAVTSASAQTLTFRLFESYLDSYREQYGIPGLSAVVLQGGEVVWQRGLGRQNIESNTPATVDTPYFIGNLSQIFGSTLLLEQCYDQDTLELSDRVIRWVPTYADQAMTIGQLLTHRSSAGSYQYDPGRFADLTAVIEECADLPYRHILAGEIFDRLAMTRSVPGRALEGIASPGNASFSAEELARYNSVLGQMARYYRLDRGRPVPATTPVLPADAATGAIATARDLGSFDRALRVGGLLSLEALTAAWTQAGGLFPMPTGLGWFVQNYNGEPLIWQFDLTKDVASSLIVKLPSRDLTFIVLANSDGLTASSGLESGNALESPFVTLFLRFFAP